jgi:hypothetical protein
MPSVQALSSVPSPPLEFFDNPLSAVPVLAIAYVAMTSINRRMFDRELKKGSAELIILSIVETRPRHGYEISQQTSSARADS